MKKRWVLVNYYTSKEILKLVSNYKNEQTMFFHVVDNSGEFNSDQDNVEVVKCERNEGYIGGLLKSLAQKPIEEGEMLIFSNSDIELDFDIRLLDKIQGDQCVYPRIRNKSGVEQNPHIKTRPTKKLWMKMYYLSKWSTVWYMYESISKLLRRRSNQRSRVFSGKEPIYAGHGSFIILKSRFTNKLTETDYNFLFGEEIHIAEFCEKNAIEKIFDPALLVHHHENVTTAKLGSKSRQFYHESYNTILNKYY